MVLQRRDGRMRQTSHPLTKMPTVVGGFSGSFDTFITQAEFYGPRRCMSHLARIDQLFLDVDTYRVPEMQGRSPEGLVYCALYAAAEVGLPAPSIVLFSGRGLYLKWFLEHPVPQRGIVRWNAVERVLVDRLAHFGADPQAKDASRVLRMHNTVNSKTGEMCRVMHVYTGPDGDPVRYNFELMAEELLPVGRQELAARKRELAQRERYRLVKGSKTSHLRCFSGRQLAWHRVLDLRRLVELRNGVREGERMKHLFWQTTFLLLSGVRNSRDMYKEAAILAGAIDPSWNHRSPELSTLYRKAKEYEAGESVEFEGRKYPSLYTPKNDTLINLFQITDGEQQQLQTIISTGMAAERHRVRREAGRRSEGAVDRQCFLRGADFKKKKARQLRKEGFSVAAIAGKLICSERAVKGYLQR